VKTAHAQGCSFALGDRGAPGVCLLVMAAVLLAGRRARR
jgi:hypothetical protein